MKNNILTTSKLILLTIIIGTAVTSCFTNSKAITNINNLKPKKDEPIIIAFNQNIKNQMMLDSIRYMFCSSAQYIQHIDFLDEFHKQNIMHLPNTITPTYLNLVDSFTIATHLLNIENLHLISGNPNRSTAAYLTFNLYNVKTKKVVWSCTGGGRGTGYYGEYFQYTHSKRHILGLALSKMVRECSVYCP